MILIGSKYWKGMAGWIQRSMLAGDFEKIRPGWLDCGVHLVPFDRSFGRVAMAIILRECRVNRPSGQRPKSLISRMFAGFYPGSR